MTEINNHNQDVSSEQPSLSESLDGILSPRKLSLKTASGINRATEQVLHLYGGDINQATSAVLEWYRANKNRRKSTYTYRRNNFATEKPSAGEKVYTGPVVNYEDEA